MNKENMRFIKLENKLADASSKKRLKELGREILLLEGIDPTLVDLKEDGISIISFSRLCQTIYELGYKDGTNERRTAKQEIAHIERKGRILKEFGQFAKQISDENLINK